jgi:hypothetical protein
MSELKTFRVTVPFTQTVCGRAFYLVEAKSKSDALEAVKNDEVCIHDTVTDGALDDFEQDFEDPFENVEVDEWS